MTLREQIVREARKYLGTPYVYLGRSAKALDCAGLLYVVFSSLVQVKSDFQDYPIYPFSATVFVNIRRYAKRIRKNDAGYGDLILMNFGGRTTHFAILTDLGIIHADPIHGKVLEQMLPDNRAVYFRMNGVPAWQS